MQTTQDGRQPGGGFPWLWISLALTLISVLLSQQGARIAMQANQRNQQMQQQRFQQQRPNFR